jgi:hypothetical protein
MCLTVRICCAMQHRVGKAKSEMDTVAMWHCLRRHKHVKNPFACSSREVSTVRVGCCNMIASVVPASFSYTTMPKRMATNLRHDEAEQFTFAYPPCLSKERSKGCNAPKAFPKHKSPS